MSVSDVDNLPWFKSSYSAGNGNCVEVAFTTEAVAVRDSKNPAGPVLRFSVDAWQGFVGAVRSGAYDTQVADAG